MDSRNKNVIFCTQCGKENEVENSFCKYCGTALRKVELKKDYSQEGKSNDYDNYSEEELDLFISKNQMFYLEKFNQITKTGDKKTWNWAAFLTGIYWMLYRKMYLQAGICFVAAPILSCIPVVGWILSIGLWIGIGIYANSIYLDHINKKFRDINCADSSYRQILISKYGGTNMVLPIVFLIIPIALFIMFLFIPIVILGSMSYYY